MADRVHKSLMNAKVGFLFYFITIFVAFFSRRIFLECLGDQFIGLTGTLYSILGFLNISELGVGTCIGYLLYLPIEKKDQNKINEMVSLFGWFYYLIGLFIIISGFIVSLFFPWMFAKENISLGIVYFAFYSFLASNVIGYFINYRQILLDSDQKTYKISQWTQTGSIIKTIIQILLSYYYRNLYLWVAIEFIFSLAVCWILNRVISKEYPWLNTNKRNGKSILRKYPEILIKVKQIVIHQLKNSFLSRCDEILIYSFESLQMVTYYGNYIMIVGKLTALFNNVFVGMNASIGNLVAEGDKHNIEKVFWEYTTFRHWTTGTILIGLTFMINPIISWWLGKQYILQDHIVFLILFQMYIMLTGPAVALFINAYGLYDDTWSAYAEGITNVIITIIIGWYYGILGILLGKIVSTLLFGVIWKPIYLYRRGFHDSPIYYWINIVKHLIILISCILLNYCFNLFFNLSVQPTLNGIAKYGLCATLPILIIYSLLIYFITPGAKDLISRLSSIIVFYKRS